MREKAKRDKEMEKEIKTEIENKEYKENEKKKNAMKWRPKRIQKRRRTYIKLLDFADFAVQAANSRIGPFASRILNLTQ